MGKSPVMIARYYFDSVTQETMWEKPPVLEALESSMAAIAQAATEQQEVWERGHWGTGEVLGSWLLSLCVL